MAALGNAPHTNLPPPSTPVKFLTITPGNSGTRRLIGQTIEFLGQTSQYQYHSNFICYPQNATATPTPGPELSTPQPYFYLDTMQKANQPNPEWTIGGGSPSRSHTDADILLGIPGSYPAFPAVLASFRFHQRSGHLMLRAMSPNYPLQYIGAASNGSDIVLEYGQEVLLHKRYNRIRIGPVELILDLFVRNEDMGAFIQQRDRLLLHGQPQGTPRPDPRLDPIPYAAQHHVNGVILHDRLIAAGGFGTVIPGIMVFNGEPVAVKSVVIKGHYKAFHLEGLRDEIHVGRSLFNTHLVSTLKTWCNHNLNSPCYQSLRDTYYIVMPLARCSLYEYYTMAKPSASVRLMLFHDALSALDSMHEQGFWHRDISPYNIIIIWDAELGRYKAAICDFGKVTTSPRSNYRYLGPLHVVAPEVHSEEGYDKSIDLFSLGYTMLYILGGIDVTDVTCTDRQRHADLMEKLELHLSEGAVGADEYDLIRRLMSFDPRSRPSVSEALGHRVWNLLNVEEAKVAMMEHA